MRIGEHPYCGFADALSAEVAAHRLQRLVVDQPGDYRVLTQLQEAVARTVLPLVVRSNRLSAAMNLGLISPRCVIDAAVAAYQRGNGAAGIRAGLRAPDSRLAGVRTRALLDPHARLWPFLTAPRHQECPCFFHIITCFFLDIYYVSFNPVIH